MIEKNILLKTISKGLESEIKEIIPCYIYKKFQIDNNLIAKKDPSLVCLCIDKFIIISEDFNEKKIIIFYENIEGLVLDSSNSNDLMIEEKEVNIEEKSYLIDKSFYFGFNNSRSKFVKSLIKWFGLYFIEKKGMIIDLPIKNNDKLLISQGNKNSVQLNFEPLEVEVCSKETYKDYSFYIKGNHKKKSDSEYEFTIEKNKEKYKINLKLLVNK